jgi:hypothetical protein
MEHFQTAVRGSKMKDGELTAALETLLTPIVEATVKAAVARHDELGDRLGYPEQEAARLLGIKPYVLRDARYRGEIKGRRVGRSHIYSRAALVRWLESVE